VGSLNKFKPLIVLIGVFALAACGTEISRLSDDDLRKKIQECDYAVSLTPAEHQVCENYHRECKRRLDNGRFVCK